MRPEDKTQTRLRAHTLWTTARLWREQVGGWGKGDGWVNLILSNHLCNSKPKWYYKNHLIQFPPPNLLKNNVLKVIFLVEDHKDNKREKKQLGHQSGRSHKPGGTHACFQEGNELHGFVRALSCPRGCDEQVGHCTKASGWGDKQEQKHSLPSAHRTKPLS